MVRGLLTFALTEPQDVDDPIYERADFVSDFFASIQQSFDGLVADRNYATLLSLFGALASEPPRRQVAAPAQRPIVRTLTSR